MEQGKLFIGNQWKSGSGSTFSSQNPATGEIIWEGKEASPEDVNAAAHHAQQAFEGWSNLSLDERTHFLKTFNDLLRDSQNEMIEIISKETGKPLWDSKNEVLGMLSKLDISLEAYHQRCADIIRDQSNGRLITRHRPHGVVAVFGPFNFPAHLPHGHIIPALLAGNTIVFKPSELTPLVAEFTVRLWQKAGLSPGVINLVQGGRETGKTLIQHPHIRGILFTGSYATGLVLSQALAPQFSKILALELGGNNPLVIGNISDIPTAASVIIQSAYLTSGQRCTCARRLILPNTPSGEELIASLKEMIPLLSIGPYDQTPEPFMGPLISEHQVRQVLQYQADLKSKGGIPLVEMQHLKTGTGFISPGLMDVTNIQERPDEEIFGPFLQIIRVKNFQEAIEEANRTKYGLCAGLLSQNQDEYDEFFRHAQAGVINWNTPLTGASSQAPFGGVKCSGNYRPSAYYAADYCVYPVASLESAELKMPSSFSPAKHLKTH